MVKLHLKNGQSNIRQDQGHKITWIFLTFVYKYAYTLHYIIYCILFIS